MKYEFKIDFLKVLKYTIYILFASAIASIPIFSFNSKLYLATWAIVGLMLILMIIYIFLQKKFLFDIATLSLILFAFSAFISSAINGFHGFNFTPILLPIATSVIYLFAVQTSSSKALKMFAFFGICLFLVVFIFANREEIIHLNFSKRLGGDFGDENDVAILFGFGFSYSFYYSINSKKIYFILPLSIISLLFAICGLLTGSRIILIILFATITISIFLRIGKKKWWLSSLIIIGIFLLSLVILTLPFFSTIKNRLVMFFETFFTDTSSRTDFSTLFRIYMFQDGIEMFLRKPLFGFGIWGFATYGGLNNGWSHNHISEGLCNFGIIGFILFHIPFVSSLYQYFNKKDFKKNGDSFVLLMFFFVSMISLSFFTQKIYAFVSAPVFASFTHKEVFKFSFLKKENKGG